MQICNYPIKTIPLDSSDFNNGELPLNRDIMFKIKDDFAFITYSAIQSYLWNENRIPQIKELLNVPSIMNTKIERHIELLHKQNALIFYIKKE